MDYEVRIHDVSDLSPSGTAADPAKLDELVHLVARAVQPSTWDYEGGGGTIQGFIRREGGGVFTELLIVRQTSDVQDDVYRFLQDLFPTKVSTKHAGQGAD